MPAKGTQKSFVSLCVLHWVKTAASTISIFNHYNGKGAALSTQEEVGRVERQFER